MITLVEQFCQQIGWNVGECTVVVEGTSDVAYFERASMLYKQTHGNAILGTDFAVVAAGQRDDGGVDGVNRRLNAARQIAEADRGPMGATRYRFVGLFDNDRAGRRALDNACRFDRRLNPYVDLFLLHPVMPILNANPQSSLKIDILKANQPFAGLDWEVEDLCSESLLARFEANNPSAVTNKVVVSGRIHRDFDRLAKPELKKYFLQHAVLSDVHEMVKLLVALRSYLGLRYSHFRF